MLERQFKASQIKAWNLPGTTAQTKSNKSLELAPLFFLAQPLSSFKLLQAVS
jgi:hypothetical protein